MSLSGALAAQSLVVKQAIDGALTMPSLQLAMAIELGPRATEALQAGLMLAFDVDWELDDGRELHQSLALRYSPLLRSYQLAVGNGHPQTFALRNALLAAMENAQLRWPDAAACSGACGGRVRVRLDPAQLPAPLRLPALFDSDWSFDSGWKAVSGGPREIDVGHVGPQGLRDAVEAEQAGANDARDCHVARCAGNVTYLASRAPCPLPRAPFQRYS